MSEETTVGRIVKILDDQRLVANKGFADGWSKGDLMVVYEEGEEVTDPETNESLGRLELVKAEVEAIHVQEKMTLLMARETEAADQPYTVLSAVLSQTPSGTMPGREAKERSRFLIRRDQVSGTPGSTPITVGDLVRKI